jgi:predicted PurR-regulated permease PerM
LLILGLPFAITIAIVGAVVEFIPFLGGALALILSSLTALALAPHLLVPVVVLYFVVTQLQAHVLQPLLYSRAVDVHPAAILIALLLGAEAGGVLGALFAVPVAVVLITLLDEIEKPGEIPPEEFSDNAGETSLADKLPGTVGPNVAQLESQDET